MAQNIQAPSIVRDVAELMRGHRRAAGAIAAAQVPVPAKDRLVIATNGQPATWQLSALPYVGDLGSSLNLSLNGLELDEAADYSVDYSTGIVTFSAGQQALFKVTPAPADVLTADYLTSDEGIASLQPDTFAPPTLVGTPGLAAADHTALTTIVAPLPSSFAAGDLLLLCVGTAGVSPSTPSGWSPVIIGDRVSVYSKTAAAGETAPTVTFPSNPGDRVTIMRAYHGSDSTPTVAASALTDVSTSTCTAGQPSFTGTTTLVYFWGYFENFSVGSLVVPSPIGNVAGIGEVVFVASSGDEVLTLAGTTPTRTATGAGGTCEWNGVTLVLNRA